MPGKENDKNHIYACYDSMSTAELRELLYLDSLLPEDECLDVDAVLYVSRLLAAREDSGTDKFTPVKEAWENFNKHYHSMDFDSESLYNDSTTAVEIVDKPKRRRPWHSVLRVACVAAALLILMFAGSLSAYAMGYDLWGAVAEWTVETFGFKLPSRNTRVDAIYEDFEAVKEILSKQDITFDVLPQWLPEGYCYKKIQVNENPVKRMVYLEYARDADHIGITISQHKNSRPRSYEKDENLVRVYEVNGIEHYIIGNNAETTIVWATENCESSIRGEFSNEDAIQIVNSIYGG